MAELEYEYSMRFDCLEEDSLLITGYLIDYLKPSKYLSVFEYSKKEKKPHIHLYMKCIKKQKTIAEWLRNQTWYKPNFYSISTIKKYENYLMYCLKDDNVLSTNLDEEYLDILREQVIDIQQDMEHTIPQKLLKYVSSKIDYGFVDKPEETDNQTLIKYILSYFKEYLQKKNGPNYQQMTGYLCYIRMNIWDTEEASKIYRNLW